MTALFRPVTIDETCGTTLPEFECGTNDRWLYAAALLCFAVFGCGGGLCNFTGAQ